MSLEQTAYLERRSVPERSALQAAINTLGFDCIVDTSYTPFTSSGFLPSKLNGDDSGFEIYFEDASAILAYFPQRAQVVGHRDVAITFRFGGDMAECACVLIVSAALAQSFDGIVHYQDDDMLYSVDDLLKAARDALERL